MAKIVGSREIPLMPPVARVGDRTTCPLAGHVGGVIVEGSPTVRANGRPVARVGDKIACGCGTTDTIVTGAETVRADGRPKARVGSRTAHGGTVVTGSPNVSADDGGPGAPQAQAFWLAARTRRAFVPRCEAASAGPPSSPAAPGEAPSYNAGSGDGAGAGRGAQ